MKKVSGVKVDRVSELQAQGVTGATARQVALLERVGAYMRKLDSCMVSGEVGLYHSDECSRVDESLVCFRGSEAEVQEVVRFIQSLG